MIDESTKTAITADDIDYWVRTGIGEARSEHHLGRVAVMCVILNRVKKKSWWGRTIKDVCLYPWQFSCWNENDPNREYIIKVDKDSAIYAIFADIVQGILEGNIPDITLGATHYHNRHIKTPTSWYKNGVKPQTIGRIDNHWFFVGID